jgi:hypothetical protein
VSHVAWPRLPNLSLRLFAAKAATATPVPLSSYECDSDAAQLLNSLDEFAHARRPTGPDARKPADQENPFFDPIGEFFHEVLSDLTSKHDSARGQPSKRGQLMTALERGLRTSPCGPCSSAGGCRACQWTGPSFAREEESLSMRGVCLSPARELFDYAARISAEAYEPIMVGGAPFIALDFSTGFVSKPSSDLGTAAQAGTTERNEEGKPPRHRVVQALFALDGKERRFSASDYLALPYIFTHECIAHAFCGVALTDTMSWTAENFHEGWMDEVAALLLEDSIMSTVRTFESKNWLYGRQEFVDSMNRVRRNRTSPVQDDPPADLPFWREGIDAFHGFQRVVEIALGSSQVRVSPLAISIAVDFSLALNSSTISHEHRGKFTSIVAQDFARATMNDVLFETQQKPYLVQAVDAYIDARRRNVFAPEPLLRAVLATQP